MTHQPGVYVPLRALFLVIGGTYNLIGNAESTIKISDVFMKKMAKSRQIDKLFPC